MCGNFSALFWTTGKHIRRSDRQWLNLGGHKSMTYTYCVNKDATMLSLSCHVSYSITRANCLTTMTNYRWTGMPSSLLRGEHFLFLSNSVIPPIFSCNQRMIANRSILVHISYHSRYIFAYAQ